MINPLLEEDVTNPCEICLSRITTRALIAAGCVAPPVEFPFVFAQEQIISILAQFLLRVGCETQTRHEREAPAEDR